MTENDNTQPKRRLFLPPPHHHWLRIIAILALVVGGIALLWFIVIRGILATEPPPTVPTIDDFNMYGSRIIVRVAEDDNIATIVLIPDGTGTYYGKDGVGERFGDLSIESDAVRVLAKSWFIDGFFDLPRVIETEGDVSIDALLALGPFEHTVACEGSCPERFITMVTDLWAEVPEDVLSEIPSFEF